MCSEVCHISLVCFDGCQVSVVSQVYKVGRTCVGTITAIYLSIDDAITVASSSTTSINTTARYKNFDTSNSNKYYNYSNNLWV